MNHSIDLRQFRYFLAVSETLHIGRAALQLHMSQPPLSRQIRQLEEQLGVELFTRNKMGVALTAAGLALVPEARRTLAQAEKAVRAAQAASRPDGGQFLVGYTTVFDHSVIPDVLERLKPAFPAWRLGSVGKHSIALVRDVRNGTLDAAFIGLHTEAEELAVDALREEALVVALPAHHALARRRRLDFSDLAQEPMFWFKRRLNPGFYDHCQAYFTAIGFAPPTLAEPADHHILLGLIAEGRGFALLPASLQHVRRSGVVYRAMRVRTPALTMGIAVAYLPGNPSPLLQAFLQLLRSPDTGQAAIP